MLKISMKIVKKIIIGMLILFAYNVFLSSLNLIIPINLVTILIVSMLDVPGVIGLALFLLMNY